MKCTFPGGCNAFAMKSDPDHRCFWHSEKTADQRRQAGRAGGRSGKIETVGDVKLVLGATIAELREGKITEAKAKAIGYLCSILCHTIEIYELQERLLAALREGEGGYT